MRLHSGFQSSSRGFYGRSRGFRMILMAFRKISEGLWRSLRFQEHCRGILRGFAGFLGGFRAFHGCSMGVRAFQRISGSIQRVEDIPNGFKRFMKNARGVLGGFLEVSMMFKEPQGIAGTFQWISGA